MKRLNPQTLFKPQAYTQVVEAAGPRTIFISGQVSQDTQGKLVAPGDFPGQARQVFANLRAGFLAGSQPPASTLIGVTALADPAYLLEIEAIAVVE